MKIALGIASMILSAFGAVIVGFSVGARAAGARHFNNVDMVIGCSVGIFLLTLGIVLLVYSVKAKK